MPPTIPGAVRRALLPLLLLSLAPQSAPAFWLLGFSPAETLPPGSLGVIAGTGAQLTRVGEPAQNSSTTFIPHAGFRVGVSDGFDLGYRLVQVAVPYTSAGPTLGGEVDAKLRLTDPADTYQAALVGGVAYSSVELSSQSKSAWSPGVDLVGSRALSSKYTVFSELRYVYTAIPTGIAGESGNHFTAGGIGTGLKIKLTPQASLVPEIGLFHLDGRLSGAPASGNAMQIGIIFSIRVW